MEQPEHLINAICFGILLTALILALVAYKKK